MNTIETILDDESLRDLRKAYHELEAFQLSDEHLAAKNRLKERLTKNPSPGEESEEKL